MWWSAEKTILANNQSTACFSLALLCCVHAWGRWGREAGGGGWAYSIRLFSPGMSSCSPSFCLITASSTAHPSLYPLHLPPSHSPFHLAVFPPFFLPVLAPPLPLSHTSPSLLFSFFWGLAGPDAGSGGGPCTATSVYSDNRDWEHAGWLPGDIHRDFIKSIPKQESCEAKLPTSSCPDPPTISVPSDNNCGLAFCRWMQHTAQAIYKWTGENSCVLNKDTASCTPKLAFKIWAKGGWTKKPTESSRASVNQDFLYLTVFVVIRAKTWPRGLSSSKLLVTEIQVVFFLKKFVSSLFRI